jgi:prepilin-type N-terminal cleavage/methylation domain-containing protein
LSDQKGFTLLEVLIAILLIGIIAAGIVPVLGTSIKVEAITRTQETAKDIAISDIENIKSQQYESDYIICNPSSGPAGTVITVPAGSGWATADTISGVTVGGIIAANTLTVNTVNGISNLSGTITVPSSLKAGTPYNVVITGSTSGVKTFIDAFTVTNVAVNLAEYGAYVSTLIVNNFRMSLYDDPNEQEIGITVSLNGKILFTLTDYRTDY